MKLRMPASIIRMPFLSLSYYFFNKSFNLTRRPAKVSFKELPFAISNHNNEQ